jgi:hypothetical protein
MESRARRRPQKKDKEWGRGMGVWQGKWQGAPNKNQRGKRRDYCFTNAKV